MRTLTWGPTTAVQLPWCAGTLGIWQGHLGFKRCTPAEVAGLEDRIVMPEDEVHLLKLAVGQPLPPAPTVRSAP